MSILELRRSKLWYHPDERKNSKFVLNLFEGEAKHFYREYVLPSCVTIREAYEKL